MKKFFMLVSILASAMITQSAFATVGKCLWVYPTTNPTVAGSWTCGDNVNSNDLFHNTGVSCVQALGGLPCKILLGTQSYTTSDCRGVNCGKVARTANFDFNIKAGGSKADLYVCEAGFLNSNCPNCGGHSLIFKHLNELKQIVDFIKAETPNPAIYGVAQMWQFSEADHVVSANLFINDVNEDAGFYVKYCVDVKRMIVGPHSPPTFTLADKLTLTPGVGTLGTKTYFDATALKTRVFKRCSKLGLLPGLIGSGILSALNGTFATPQFEVNDFGANIETVLDFEQEILTLGPTHTEADGTKCYEGHCSWTVVFKEINNCMVRNFDDGGQAECHGSNCVAREAKIKTQLDFNLDFCPDGNCH